MVPLALVLAVLMGVIVGMLGAGGSILTVPLLVYLAGLEPKVAIASSLLVVGLTSAGGVVHHAWQGNVRWRPGFIFGALSMVGAFTAGSVARFVPGDALLLIFAAVMAASSIGLMRYRPGAEPSGDSPPPPVVAPTKMAALGLAVGAITGLVGAGGGFLIVPVLVMLGRLDMRGAVGTSLLVIVLNAFAAFAGYLFHVEIEWVLALSISAAAMAGALGGAALSGIVSQTGLRHAFAWFVLLMAVFIASHQLLPRLVTHRPRADGLQRPLAGAAPDSAASMLRGAASQAVPAFAPASAARA